MVTKMMCYVNYIIPDKNTKHCEDWWSSQKLLNSDISSVKQQYLCLHAGLQYNDIDCSGGWVEWLRPAVCLSVHLSGPLLGYLFGTCLGSVSEYLTKHQSRCLSAVCQGISWSVSRSNCQGVSQDIPLCICCQVIFWGIYQFKLHNV